MRRNTAKFIAFIGFASLCISSGAHAHRLDMTVANFIECDTAGTNCIAHNDAYERFLAEYAFGVSPKIMAPATTLGYSGFYLGLEGSLTLLPQSGTKRFSNGNYTDARWRIGAGEYNAEPPAMFFPTLHVRKGLPWSVEVGSSISYLASSELVALGGEIKWAPFEGFIHGPPALAVRGSVNRIIGETDVDFTIMGVDGSLSYPFGIGGMVSLEPYAGYQFLVAFVRTEPMILRTYNGANVTFHPSDNADDYSVAEAGLTGPNLFRHKIFFGLNFRFEVLSITMDWAWGLKNSWKTEQFTDLTRTTLDKDTRVEVATQFTYTFGAALQF